MTQELETLRDTFKKIANGHDNDFAKWANVIDRHLTAAAATTETVKIIDALQAFPLIVEEQKRQIADAIDLCAREAEDWFTLPPASRTKATLLGRILRNKGKRP